MIDVPAVSVMQNIPLVVQRLIPMVSLTMEIPQLLFDMVVLSLVWQFHSCRGEETVVAPTVAAGGSTSWRFDVDIPVVTQRPFLMVQPVWRTIEIPQSLFDKVYDVPGVMVFVGWGPVHRHRARDDPRHQGGEGVAGTAGSLTPRCSATRISCKQLYGMERHVIQAQRPHPTPPPGP